MNYIKQLKCLIQRVNTLFSNTPELDFNDTTNILTSVYSNGQSASTPVIIDYNTILNTPVFKVVENEYQNISSLYADKVNQTSTFIQFVEDASLYSEVDSGEAYFEYLGTNNGDETDYRLLSNEESAPLGTVISKTSDIPLNDGEDGTSKYIEENEISLVGTSNNYQDLDNLPNLAPSNAEENVQSDWTQLNNTEDNFIKNKPSNTSNFTNDGQDGNNPFITVNDIPDVPEYTLSNVNGSNQFDLLKDNVVIDTIDLTPYLDDTNLARIVSGVVEPTTGIATITRDDNTTFTIDFSSLIDVQPVSTQQLLNEGVDGTSTYVENDEIVESAKVGLSIRNTNNTEQFKAEEFLQLKGGTFDSNNNRWSVDPLAAFTVFIHSTNGNNTTGELNNQNLPFQNFFNAYNEIPNDGNIWEVVYLDTSNNRKITAITTKRILLKSSNSGTFIFENETATNLTNTTFFGIDAPFSDFTIANSNVATGLRPTNLFLNVRDINLNVNQSGFSGFLGSGRSSSTDTGYIKCQNLNASITTGYLRMFGYAGDFVCNKLTISSSGVKFRDDQVTFTRLNVREYVANGTPIVIESMYGANSSKVEAYSGTQKITDRNSKFLNVNGVDFNCPSFDYEVNSIITGKMTNLNYEIESTFANFENFTGRIKERGPNNSPMNFKNSTIYLNSTLAYTFGFISSVGNITIDNSNIIQNTPGYLVRSQNSSVVFNLKKIGVFKTNANSFHFDPNGNGFTIQDLTPNTF